MSPFVPPRDYARIRCVSSFEELVAAPFAGGVNALCWPRALPGDFAEIAAHLGAGEGVVALEEPRLRSLTLSAAARAALDAMLTDLARLREQDRDPVLNLIHSYPHDEDAPVVATDVYSFHADSAPIAADTWLCTYRGAPSEGLRNEEARRRVDIPETRAELLREFGGGEGPAFHEYLHEHCYDLHYAPQPGAQPFSFGVGHLWRIAVDHPGSAVPPCIHRAPATRVGEASRLLLIS
jgi:hypothetical protein